MNSKLYVGNLSYSVDDQSLRDAFASHGELVSASVVMDRDSGQSRGFGFVEYASAGDAQRAIDAMNGANLEGRTLSVNIARPREGGDRSFGGGGGGDRSFGGGGGRGGGRGGDRGGKPRRW